MKAAGRQRVRGAVLRRVLVGLLPCLAACAGGGDAPTPSAEAPERLRVVDDEFAGVEGAAFHGGRLVVLTRPEPAVHLFAGGGAARWGKDGEGPAELRGPQNLAWVGDRLLVRDHALKKIVSYDAEGRFVASRPLGGMRAVRMQVAGGDTLLGLFDPFRPERQVVRLAGAHVDTVLRYANAAEPLTLEAPGAPSLTLPAPYSAVPLWAGLPDGRLAYWDGSSEVVRILDRGGREVARFPLPGERFPVSEAGREAWFTDEIPVDRAFGQRDIFAPVRETARREVAFPADLPAALALVADPDGGVWVRRTPAADGEVWTRVGPAGATASVRLPARRRLLAVSDTEMAARALDDLDVETVEVYRKPRGGAGPAEVAPVHR